MRILSKSYVQQFHKSIWFFPLVITFVLCLLTILKIDGSSIGVYHAMLYGNSKDASLILNKPRHIRSDEWVVNTQMTIAQHNAGYPRINKNIGNGEDMSVILDVPYKEWSEVFKPHNLAFFVLPFEQAFAFKWWFMAYLLVLSCYFFILTMLPNRKLLAAGISIALLFSAFIQWWYQYITLAPIYYGLFIATVIIHLLHAHRRRTKLVLSTILIYLLVCFALALYPPFQIPCALALGAFLVGYFIEWGQGKSRQIVLRTLGGLALVALVGGAITGIFFITRTSVIHTVESTVYPGKRIVQSGGFDFSHTFSGHLGYQFLSGSRSDDYQITKSSLTNQSESSNFILLQPFLFLPSLYLLYGSWKSNKKRSSFDWPLLFVNGMFLVFMAWLFVPHLAIIGKLLLLNRVPLTRLLIGVGLINILQLVVFIRHLSKLKETPFTVGISLLYVFIVGLCELGLGLHAMHSFPGFIGRYRVIAYALPVPVIMFALLRRRFNLAIMGYVAFSCFIGIGINPLYRGTDILTQTPISVAIQKIRATHQPGKWIVEEGDFENFPIINGVPSLSGVFAYPQLSLWNPIDHGKQQYIYNRYAHVNFVLIRDNPTAPTTLIQPTLDHFGVVTPTCSKYFQQENVRFIITPVALTNSCVKLLDTVRYPAINLYIYHINSYQI